MKPSTFKNTVLYAVTRDSNDHITKVCELVSEGRINTVNELLKNYSKELQPKTAVYVDFESDTVRIKSLTYNHKQHTHYEIVPVVSGAVTNLRGSNVKINEFVGEPCLR